MTNARLADAAAPPAFADQLACDVEQLTAQLRTALAGRRRLQPASPPTPLCTGTPEIAVSGNQARTILRALAPLALTRGRSAIRTGTLSLEIARLLTALAACGRGTAGNPADLDEAIAATLALLETLKGAAWSLRWRQATTRAGTRWPDPHPAPPIIAVLRQQTPRARERRQNAFVAAQRVLLLPIGGATAEPPIGASTTAAEHHDAGRPAPLRTAVHPGPPDPDRLAG